MTKTELSILKYVGRANSLGALAGLGDEKEKFVNRLRDAGKIVYLEWTPKYGAGWVLPENVDKFKN